MIKWIVSFLIIFLSCSLTPNATLAQETFVLSYDKNGLTPPGKEADRILASISEDDSLVVRFYQSSIFSLDGIDLPKSAEDRKAFFVYPENKELLGIQSPLTIHPGIGKVFFIGGRGSYALRFSDKNVPSGTKLDLTEIRESIINQGQTTEEISFKKAIVKEGRWKYKPTWELFVFNNEIEFQEGSTNLQLLRVGEKDATVEDSIEFRVTKDFNRARLRYRYEGGRQREADFEPIAGEAYLEAVLPELAEGIMEFQVVYDLLEGSGTYERVRPRTIGYSPMDPNRITIHRKRLPLRFRSGMFVTNSGDDVALSVGLTLIGDPEVYFSKNTPFLNKWGLYLGLQGGGAGAEGNFILLYGLSFKINNVADIVGGFRFGTQNPGGFDEDKDWFGGISVDIGILQELMSKTAK